MNQKCELCNGTGEVDSGGTQPWGEGISVACPKCSTKNAFEVYAGPLEDDDWQLPLVHDLGVQEQMEEFRRQICGIWGVPMHMLSGKNPAKGSYASIEELSKYYEQVTATYTTWEDYVSNVEYKVHMYEVRCLLTKRKRNKRFRRPRFARLV